MKMTFPVARPRRNARPTGRRLRGRTRRVSTDYPIEADRRELLTMFEERPAPGDDLEHRRILSAQASLAAL